ncbi:hypothetical protein N0V90_009544 [Kalmusia sp. IMI 367209]|nr:hypothetical protein N0V90_009544 [Kalmusia sp. IMI 367209]
MLPTPSLHSRSLDLEVLESDHVPTFVIKTADQAIPFNILYCNEAFRRDALRDIILEPTSEAIIFRSWTLAVGFFSSEYKFAGRSWTATVAGTKEDWKISLQRMMEMSDVGVFEYLPSGKLIQANDAWYRLSNHPRDLPAHVDFSFMDLAYPEDRDTIMSAWNSLIRGHCVTFEMRWKARPGSSEAGNTIDINAQKKSQEIQRRQITEALEAKRQQENFIDMTSHELRNPLSAVIQCADSVISTLQQFMPKELFSMNSHIEKAKDEISTCIDNLQTIVTCSLHQKRIIDDVLTLSKLDSNLLQITPMCVQPALVVSEAIKMFDVECSQVRISLDFKEDESLKEFAWVMLDPSRLLQVLINLL